MKKYINSLQPYLRLDVSSHSSLVWHFPPTHTPRHIEEIPLESGILQSVEPEVNRGSNPVIVRTADHSLPAHSSFPHKAFRRSSLQRVQHSRLYIAWSASRKLPSSDSYSFYCLTGKTIKGECFCRLFLDYTSLCSQAQPFAFGFAWWSEAAIPALIRGCSFVIWLNSYRV